MLHKFLVKALTLLFCIILDQTGALKVKSLDAAAPKWEDRARGAATEFADRAEAAAQDWATNTAKAVDTFAMAISAPGIKERFRRGVNRAGAAKFARKITSVARDRYAPGVSAATGDYRVGVEPYFATLAALTLDQRKPKGDPANYRRVEQVGKALNAKRLALLGASASSS